MKLKALKNLDGVVKAFSGQEFEVANQQQAKDLIQQGVATPVDNQGAEVQGLMNQSQEDLAMQAELEAIERSEYQRAYSEEMQKELNVMEDQKQEKIQQVKEQAKQKAQSQMKQNNAQNLSSQEHAQIQKDLPKTKLNDQTF